MNCSVACSSFTNVTQLLSLRTSKTPPSLRRESPSTVTGSPFLPLCPSNTSPRCLCGVTYFRKVRVKKPTRCVPSASGSCHSARCCGRTLLVSRPWVLCSSSWWTDVPLHEGPQLAKRSSSDGHGGSFRHFTAVDTVAMSARVSVRDPVFRSFG